MKRRTTRLLVIAGALALVAAACGGDNSSGSPTTSAAVSATTTAASGGTTATTTSGDLTDVRLQFQWFNQAQFAGYLAAVEQGFYAKRGLNVETLEGGVDIIPQQVLANGGADFALAWVPKALQTREQGADIVNIAQIFQRSGTLQVSFKKNNLTDAAALRGKKVGNWGGGNEYELFAGMTKAGIDPGTDVELVGQQFDMQALLSGDIDAAQAMIYNEYAQVLEATNPETGKLYQPTDFNVIDWNTVGTAMLQDAVWADGEKLRSDTAYQDTAVKLIAGSIEGWAYCRDNAEACREIVVAAGSKLGNSHQLWQMNEINKLIWPSPAGAGITAKADWDRTVTVASETKNAEGKTVLTKAPDADAYTNTYVEKALAELKAAGVDVNGTTFKPITVTLEPGGA